MQKSYFLKLTPIVWVLGIACLYLWHQSNSTTLNKSEEITKTKLTKKTPRVERKKARSEYFHRLMRDPVTNKIPTGIRQKELRQAEKLAATTLGKSATPTDFNWREVGPTNVGGRTRALAYDRTNNNIILAGGVDGGLWKSSNGGTGWTLTSDQTQNSSVTSVAQDPQTPTTWYFTTGEFRASNFDDQIGLTGNDVRASGATGFFKSTNNGDSWTFIPHNNTTVQFPDEQFPNNNPFAFTSKVLVHPTTSDVFVVTHGFGIFRSQDGGTTFTAVLTYTGAPVENRYNDLVITSTGRLIAYLGGERSNGAGIYVSTNNGTSWGTNIASTTFISATEVLERAVLATVPTDADIFYAFTQPETGSARLFKFDLSTTTPTETNLSANLHPQTSTQESYNMVLAVHPTDPDIIIIGGVSLFRSTDGMTTQLGGAGQNLIGGPPEVNEPGFYPKSHPDNHSLAFDPTNPDVMLNGNDGGIKKTADIQAGTVVWESLNNGYNVTQYYVGDTKILDTNGNIGFVGGAQDNGSQYMKIKDCDLIAGQKVTIAPNPADGNELNDLSSGDGSYCAIGTNFIYASAQQAFLWRVPISDPDRFSSGELIEPDFNSLDVTANFIQHFALDPNSDDNGYMALNGGILRNTAMTGNNAATSWGFLIEDEDINFSAARVSKSPANILYAASYDDSGQPTIYRFTNASAANASNTTTTNIPNMSNGSYVNEIAINPANADEIIVVVSNYNVESLFHSTDGGSTFTTIEGNLGGNDGPSIRDAEITTLDGNPCYFVATTTGLYSTTSLNGSSTQWTQAGAAAFGNTIVSRLDFDQQTDANGDEFCVLAVATHGRGMFTGFKTPRCKVDAGFTPSSGTYSLCDAPVNIMFTDTSTGNPTSWNWTFSGAGVSPTTSTDQNPTVAVSEAGTLTVTLMVSDGTNSDSQSYTYTVEACATPVVAEFTPTTGTYSLCNGPVNINFTDASTGDPTSWNWTFAGAGVSPTTSTDQNPMVTVSQAGTLTVTLMASNGANNDSKIYTFDVQACAPPVAAFTPTTGTFSLCNVPVLIEFTDASTGGPTDWNWTFSGAGVSPTTSTDQDPDVTVTQAGTLTVTLTVTNTDGTNSITQTYTVEACAPPVAEFTPNMGTFSLCNGAVQINFTDASTGNPTAWNWTFSGAGVSPTTSTVQNPTVTVSQAGTLTATLMATGAGGSNTKAYTYTVQACNLAAAFTPPTGSNINLCNNPTSVAFLDASTGNPTSWNWTFSGAGVSPTTSTAQNPTVTVNAVGTLTATLMVSDGTNSVTTTQTYNVTVCSPTVAFTPAAGSTYDLCNGAASIAFMDASAGNPTSWNWTFNGAGVSPTSSTDQNPTVTVSTPGPLTVTLTVNNGNASDSQTATYTVTKCPQDCEFAFTTTNEDGSNGSVQPFYYNTTTIVLDGLPPYNFDWDRDGFVRIATSTRADGKTEIKIIYSSTAFWQVDIEDIGGCTASISNTPSMRISDVNITATNGNNAATGGIAFEVIGGTAPYTYQWYGPRGFNSTDAPPLTDLAYGWYNVSVCDNSTPSQCVTNWFWVAPYTVIQNGGLIRGKTMPTGVAGLSTYPNPFDRQATILFQLPADGLAEVAVFSLTGQKVADLFKGVVKQGETYTTTLEGNQLTNGIYIVQLTAADGTRTYEKVVFNK